MRTLADGLGSVVKEFERRKTDPEYRQEQKDRLASYLAKFDCRKCEDTGEVDEYLGIVGGKMSYARSRCQDCLEGKADEDKRMRISGRMRYAGVPHGFVDKTFRNFDLRTAELRPDQSQMLREGRKAAARVATDNGLQPWLLLMGPPGVGKTHLAAAIVNHRAKDLVGAPAKWLNVPEWLSELRRGFADNSTDGKFQEAVEAPVLVIDDLGAEYHRTRSSRNGESWAAEQLYRLVDYRYARRSPTVITTNASISEMQERVASRVADTGSGLVQMIYLKVPSYRSISR